MEEKKSTRPLLRVAILRPKMRQFVERRLWMVIAKDNCFASFFRLTEIAIGRTPVMVKFN